MKKKIIKIFLIVIVSLLCIGVLRAAILYLENYGAGKRDFKDEYIQIIYPTSICDYITAREVMKEADEALSTLMSHDEAVEKFGELGYLCVTHPDAVTEKHKLRFIAANFSGDEGYVWIEYSSEAYDKEGNCAYGSSSLSKLELKKENGEWIVINIRSTI